MGQPLGDGSHDFDAGSPRELSEFFEGGIRLPTIASPLDADEKSTLHRGHPRSFSCGYRAWTFSSLVISSRQAESSTHSVLMETPPSKRRWRIGWGVGIRTPTS